APEDVDRAEHDDQDRGRPDRPVAEQDRILLGPASCPLDGGHEIVLLHLMTGHLWCSHVTAPFDPRRARAAPAPRQSGGRGRTRTPGQEFRKLLLYPPELHAPAVGS